MIFSHLQKLKNSSTCSWEGNNCPATTEQSGTDGQKQTQDSPSVLAVSWGSWCWWKGRWGRLPIPPLCGVGRCLTPHAFSVSGRRSWLSVSVPLYRSQLCFAIPSLAACRSRKDRGRDGSSFTIAFSNSGLSTVNGNSDTNWNENILYPYRELYKMSQNCSVLGFKKRLDWSCNFPCFPSPALSLIL